MVLRPTRKQRAEMEAFVDMTQPGLIDELGITRTVDWDADAVVMSNNPGTGEIPEP